MTDKPTPTDAELDALRQADNGELNFVTLRQFRVIARAVLAKWGSPVVAGEPLAWKEYAQHLEGCRTCAEDAVGACHEGSSLKVSAMAAPTITSQPTQAQAGAVPLTHDEALDAFCHTPGIHQFVQAFMAGVRFAEQHHGIKGGQP